LAASNSRAVVILSLEVIEAFSESSRASAGSVYGLGKIRSDGLIQARESFVGRLAISTTAEFGRSILNLMRERVHRADPDEARTISAADPGEFPARRANHTMLCPSPFQASTSFPIFRNDP
jgi:hypothetical protein